MATTKQMIANKRNAQKSTGPKTEAGKDKSRRNALKHGLAGNGIVLPTEETEVVAGRYDHWFSSIRPWNEFESWMFIRICVDSIRVEQAMTGERAERRRLARRAETS